MKFNLNTEIQHINPKRLRFGMFQASCFRIHTAHAGFTLVEGVVAIAILAAVLIGVTNIAQFSSRLLDGSQNTLSASFLSEEGVEAVKSIRDAGWGSGITPLILDTDYWLAFSGGRWTLSQVPQPLIGGFYERKIRFSSVSRDGQDDIVLVGGTVDTNTKKVSVSVAWSYRGATTTDTVAAYITNLFGN